MTDTHGTADMVTTATPTDPAELLVGHVPLVRKLANRAARRRGLDPDEVAAEAMLRGVRFLDRYDPARGSMGAWVGQLVWSVSSHMAATRAARMDRFIPIDAVDYDILCDDAPRPHRLAHANDVAERVRSAVASLDGPEREAAERLLAGGSVGGAARESGRDWRTIRRHEASAREKLRELLADLEHDRD